MCPTYRCTLFHMIISVIQETKAPRLLIVPPRSCALSDACNAWVYIQFDKSAHVDFSLRNGATSSVFVFEILNVIENKILSCCEAFRCETIQKVFFMSNLQIYYHFKLDLHNLDQHTESKWFIHGTKRHKDYKLQSPELSCRIAKMEMLAWHKGVRR